jgi:hypothetical protein
MHIQVSQVRILVSTRVPFRPTTVQMPNLALVETKLITVHRHFLFSLAVLYCIQSVILLTAVHALVILFFKKLERLMSSAGFANPTENKKWRANAPRKFLVG